MVLRRRFELALALALALAGVAPAAALEKPRQSAVEPSPVALVGARCVFCHGPAVMLSFSRNLLSEGGPEALDTFLERHHAPDKAARDAIVRFLVDPAGSSN